MQIGYSTCGHVIQILKRSFLESDKNLAKLHFYCFQRTNVINPIYMYDLFNILYVI